MKLFDHDGPLMRALTYLGNLILLNLVYLLCCLPVVTAGAASAAAGGEAGQAITLNKAPLYVSSTAKNKAGTKTGTYWLYDGILINGRYRVTNSAARCGKLPVGQNVTGWVPASYCIASEEAKK